MGFRRKPPFFMVATESKAGQRTIHVVSSNHIQQPVNTAICDLHLDDPEPIEMKVDGWPAGMCKECKTGVLNLMFTPL